MPNMLNELKRINEEDEGYTTGYIRKTSDKDKLYEFIKHASLDELNTLDKRIKQLIEQKQK